MEFTTNIKMSRVSLFVRCNFISHTQTYGRWHQGRTRGQRDNLFDGNDGPTGGPGRRTLYWTVESGSKGYFRNEEETMTSLNE